MNSPSTVDSATASPPASLGGTAVFQLQFSPFDVKQQFLHEQSSREQLQSTPNDIPASTSRHDDALVQNKIIEHETLTTQPSPVSVSSCTSPDAISKFSTCFPPSLASSVQLQSIDERYAQVNVDSSLVTPESARSSRMRELSAPLPSVPPSTPASSAAHRSSLSQPHNFVSIPAPVALHMTPLSNISSTFLSPSDDHYSDQECETSDSNSIEIISGYASDSIVNGRPYGREGLSISQGFIESTRVSDHRTSTPASINSANLYEARTLSRLPFSASVTESTLSTSSHTPTPLPAPGAISPSRSSASEMKSGTGSSESPSPSSQSFLSPSKSPSPSRAQPRLSALNDGRRIPSEASSPTQHSAQRQHEVQERTSHEDSIQETEKIIRTPNVYINGLPPHFPDESLYLMTREFGHVLSVRTFTRCVGEKMSGYGFVLFDGIDPAERCIETLRKYRNLHPSYSKQVHKIPGTPYASGVITLPPAGSLPSLSSQSSVSSVSSFPSLPSSLISPATASSIVSGPSPTRIRGHYASESISTISGSDFSSKDSRDMSFREKMEKLKDHKSTNLYMEGLPLNIDDVSLAALVSPHKIVSSRFFQTKLSNPPRMIAFVRLETRLAAEEVIERLHGRVVRGWNDNGCRISVRFADTNEQRELRRAERLLRGEEEEIGTATRLSMAQAALINLRGAEAQAQIGARTYQHQSSPGTGNSGRSFQASATGPEIGSANLHTTRSCHSLPSSQLLQNSQAFGLSAQSAALGFGPAAFTKGPSPMNMARPLTGPGIPLSVESLDASRLALLQQQNQLQQLQLLQQMQNMASGQNWKAMDHAYALDSSRLQPHTLMPPVDIVSEPIDDAHPEYSTGHGFNSRVSRSQGLSRAHAQQHSPLMSKLSTAGIPGASSLHDSVHTRLRHTMNEDRILHNRQSSLDLSASARQTISLYSSSASRSNGAHLHDELSNSNNRRHASILEENEIPNVSPALTYASRSPATLSPTTPLFNTFGTPASAPATVPLGKLTLRDREHRAFRHELRQ